MASQQRPKGTKTRQPADWNVLATCSVGGYFRPSDHTKTPAFDLFNEARDGSCLWVYNIFVNNDGEGLYHATQITGHGANGPVQGIPIVTGVAPVYGQLFQDVVSGFIPPANFPLDTLLTASYYFDEAADAANNWAAQGPLCVVTPGNSFRVVSDVAEGVGQPSGGMLIVSFYYTVMPTFT